ncbi:MAG: hypothetical protein QOF20_2635 [Acidimicrobiaceae bacterium]|jgi:hypothetical protein|nr:hypothetical protein [Acidimicrobiaceae bacterium]MDQ1370282.1 hypothetical protein [Acidimicrobiaceae bacterium]MDQ1377349.1 hypothetical protein [Acidimicrobiaceae bacterium]MDQ1417705.1 hypothetical protein [Acidimicrobiaceae bacterium]
MAKRQVVSYTYTCDVCGDPIPDSDGDSATRKVSWEGTDYVLDVCAKHGSMLGDVLSQLKGFVDAGHRDSGRRGRRAVGAASASAPRAPQGSRAAASKSTSGTSPKRGDLGAIRAWARDNGHKVSARGRIPTALLAAFDAAQGAIASGSPSTSTSTPDPEATPPRKRGPRKAAKAAAG